jgi:hypothetical protein
MKSSLRILILAAVVVSLAACSGAPQIRIGPTDEPPGVGEKAERGYAASEPVIAALEAFRTDHGAYPELMVYLVPNYLPVLWTGGEDLDYSYSTSDSSFTFSFHYIGPGMNTCTYKPDANWRCSGAY